MFIVIIKCYKINQCVKVWNELRWECTEVQRRQWSVDHGARRELLQKGGHEMGLKAEQDLCCVV
jgi:hypothetical protein